MGLVEILILGIAVWICIYALIERICRCCENREMYRAYAAYLTAVAKGVPAGAINAETFLKSFMNKGGNTNSEK